MAFGITAKNNPALDISNMDLTFFAGFNKVTTAAVPDATTTPKSSASPDSPTLRKGYAEFGYGYVDADDERPELPQPHRRVHQAVPAAGWPTASGVIGNFGQEATAKTADGVLLLIENSLIPRRPMNAIPSSAEFVPYFNLFAGFDTPQPLARAADTGGVLKNTGINFESDGLTGYPTLDASAHGFLRRGGGSGVPVRARPSARRGRGGRRSAWATARWDPSTPSGLRYQHPITNAWIVRADAMHGWREGQKDVYGVRVELRRKF